MNHFSVALVITMGTAIANNQDLPAATQVARSLESLTAVSLLPEQESLADVVRNLSGQQNNLALEPLEFTARRELKSDGEPKGKGGQGKALGQLKPEKVKSDKEPAIGA